MAVPENLILFFWPNTYTHTKTLAGKFSKLKIYILVASDNGKARYKMFNTKKGS